MSDAADKTYSLHSDENRIYGFSSGKEAIEQMIYKILSTERYEWKIYSDDYGCELCELFGKPKSDVMEAAEEIITDALLSDERILGVNDFDIQEGEKCLLISFSVETDYGDISVTKEIS